MTQRILVISGRKQSGKDSLGNFLIANHSELFGSGHTVRKFGFADPLKQMVSDLFNIPLAWTHGTEQDKNRETGVTWGDLPHRQTLWENGQGAPASAPLTVRELLQQFGTNIVRQMNPTAWTSALQKRIERSDAALAVITDARFSNEILAAKEWGGKAIRLRRNEGIPAEHESEWALDWEHFDWKHFDAVIDNRDMGHTQQCRALHQQLLDWNWLTQGETK